MVTEAGTARAVLLLDKAIAAPPAGAALLSVTVQTLEELDPRVDGLHASDVTTVEATRETAVVAEVVPKDAVRVAL